MRPAESAACTGEPAASPPAPELRAAPPEPIDVSVVVPAFREAENLPHLCARLDAVFRAQGWNAEVIIADDDSRDGTVEWAAACGLPWVRLLVRRSNKGLSPSIVDGLALARGNVLVVLDADLSHPPEAIPALAEHLRDGADFVIGSRYVRGGTTDEQWGRFREWNSRVATWLARPFAPVKDPMSGFFALRREAFVAARHHLNPIGYKIGLELIVKCRCRRIEEVPIHFTDRRFGESKLSALEQLKYLRHLRRLFVYKFSGLTHAVRFAAVGSLGALLNLGLLTLFLDYGMTIERAAAGAIGLSMLSNVYMKERQPHEGPLRRPGFRDWLLLFAVFMPGALLNYAVMLTLLRDGGAEIPQLAALGGIASGTLLNFMVSRRIEMQENECPPE